MSHRIDENQYFTRRQSDTRYLRLPQPPAPPTALTLSGSGVVQTGQDVHAFLDVSLTPPATPSWNTAPQYVEAYVFTYTYTSVSSVTRSVVIPFNPANVYRLDPIPTGVAISITAKTVDFSGQVSTTSSTALNTTAPADSVPPAARTITATVLSGGGVLVALDALNTEADFSIYELWRGEGPNAGAVVWGLNPLFTFLATAVEDRNIPTSASDYFYKVVSKDFSGNGSTSNIFGPLVLITTNIPPPPAPNLAGGSISANTDGSITVTWPAVTSTGLAGFRVWRRLHGTTPWTQIQNITGSSGVGPISYADNLVVNGVQYDYTVTSYNAAGDESAFPGTVLTATSSDTTAPASPGGITATGRLGGVYTVWTASISPDVASYGVSFRLTPVASYSTEVRVNANQFTLLGLTQTRDALANNLGLKVVAYDSANNASTASTYTVQFPDLAGYTPADATIPAGPASLTPTKNDDGSILLSWPASVSSDRSGYQVEKYEALNVQGFHIQTSGGTSTLKYFISPVGVSAVGQSYRVTLWVQNLANTSVRIGGNVVEGPIILPGERLFVDFTFAGDGVGPGQLRFETLLSSDNVNVVAFQPQITRASDGTTFITATSQNFFTSWNAFSGATLVPGGQPPNQTMLINDFWDIEGIVQDDTPGTKTFRIGGLEPFSYRGKQYRFRVRTTDYSGNISSINYIEDPSFESGSTASWVLATDSGAVASVSTTTPNSGLNSLTANQAARPSQTIPVVAGLSYSWSAFMRSNGITTPSVVLLIEWYTATGQASSIRTSDTASPGITPTTSYQRLSVSAVAPADAGLARAYLYDDPALPTTSVLWDDAQFEQASSPTPFNITATAFINAIDQVAPLDYVSVNGTNFLNLTALGTLGTISLRWNLPPSTFSGAFDYIDSVFEIWRQVTVSAQTSLPVDGAFRKVSEVRGGMGPASGSAFLNFDDLDPDETFNITASYKLKARDRFGNVSGFLNGGAAVSATSKTPNDIQITRKDGLFPSAPAVSGTTGATANSNGTITVTWTGSTTSGRADLGGYHIYRQANGAGNYIPVGDVFTNAEGGSQSWIDTGLDIGSTTYNYKVSGFDTALEESSLSTASNTVTPIDNRTPSPPTNVIVKGSVGGIQLLWTSSSTQGVTRYAVTVPAIVGQPQVTMDVNGTGTFVRLAGGPSAAAIDTVSFYTFITVQAYSISGGALSAGASPTNIIPDSDGTARLWTINATLPFVAGIGVISGGGWRYTGTGAASGFQTVDTPIFTVVPLTTYTISGYIDASHVTLGTPCWFVYDPTIVTQYGAAVQVPGTNGRVSGTFTVPAGVTQVRVLPDTSNATVTNGTFLTFSDPQLEIGSVATAYQSSLPEMSAYVPIDTIPPSDPSVVIATDDGQGSVTVSWTGSSSADVFSYILEMAQETANLSGVVGTWIAVGATYAPTVSMRVPGLQPTVITGLRYQFRVKALDNSNNASNYATSALTVITVDTTAPAVPSGVTATTALEADSQTTTSRVNISWTKALDRDLAMYIIEFFRTDGVGGHSFYTISPLTTSHAIGALKNGVQYAIIMYSQDYIGNRSAGSTQVNVTTPTPPGGTNHSPGPPTLVSVTSGTGPDASQSTITVTFTVGFGGGSAGPEASAPFTFPADSDLSYASIRRAGSTQAGTAVGPQSGTTTVSAAATNGSSLTYTEVVGRNGDLSSYSLFYKIQIIDTSGATSTPSSEISVSVAGYNDGGSGPPLCAAEDMYLPDGCVVGEVPPGHEFLCLEGNRLLWRRLRVSEFGWQPCVRLRTDNGCSVIVSEETPMELADGSYSQASEMENQMAATLREGHLEWSLCHVEKLGPRRVRRTYLGGAIFAAGELPDRCIFTHNPSHLLPKA